MKFQRAATENKSHGHKLLSQTEAKMKREMACERGASGEREWKKRGVATRWKETGTKRKAKGLPEYRRVTILCAVMDKRWHVTKAPVNTH